VLVKTLQPRTKQFRELFFFFCESDRLYYIRTLHPDPPLLHKGPCKMRKIQIGPDHLLQQAASPAIGQNEAESNHLHSRSTQALGMPQDSAAHDSHTTTTWLFERSSAVFLPRRMEEHRRCTLPPNLTQKRRYSSPSKPTRTPTYWTQNPPGGEIKSPSQSQRKR
jgi:hypothetical protein